jgi:2-keto-4-pentenoate hydratase/2-oxohepta-3-ene-1,7-dioic acid hydratase in catechol pathway
LLRQKAIVAMMPRHAASRRRKSGMRPGGTMRLIHFSHAGTASFGAVVGDTVIDFAGRLGAVTGVRQLLEADALDDARKLLDKSSQSGLPLGSVSLLPPLPDAPRIFCAGVNYDEHRQETGRSRTENPVLFMRGAEANVAHGQPIIRPPESRHLDYEGELAVVIGRPGRRIARNNALQHVAGYSCFNDGTIRDWQRHTHQFTPGKNWDGTGGFGPWLVTADEIPDPSRLTLTTRLNGQTVQQSGTDRMIFDIPDLIAYISTFTTLRPGDVIATGTPGGVGDKRTPPLYMKAGDIVEVEVTGVGILANPIVDG